MSKIIVLLSHFVLLIIDSVNGFDNFFKEPTDSNVSLNDWFQQLNDEYKSLNQYLAYYTWEINVNFKNNLQNEAVEFNVIRANWKTLKCNEAKKYLIDMNQYEKRIIFLLCRGPDLSSEDERQLSTILGKMNEIYTDTKICLIKDFNICKSYQMSNKLPIVKNADGSLQLPDFSFISITKNNTSTNEVNEELLQINKMFANLSESQLLCKDIDSYIEEMMSLNCNLTYTSSRQRVWESWKLAIGPKLGKEYLKVITYMNNGAIKNGYNTIGECWNEDIEIHNLEEISRKLFNDIKPFYQLLHGVLRYFLIKQNISHGVKSKGLLPAHILGKDMWASNWVNQLETLMPTRKVNVDKNLYDKNWTTLDMVKRSEDFYTSLGLNPMTEHFWKNSQFNKTDINHNNTKCHGGAANFFNGNDYRIVVCPKRNLDGFYEIVHEMGHIEYYMHLNDLPAIFQDPANSAFGETIGDTIFLGLIAPQHLNRLGLVSDESLYPEILSENLNQLNPLIAFRDLHMNLYHYGNFKSEPLKPNLNDFDLSLLLQMALSRIPEIPFQHILYKFRQDLFSEKIDYSNANDYFLQLITNEQGIYSSTLTNHHIFYDFATNFYIVNNIPNARYFLSSFLQYQIFKGLCEYSVFNELNSGKKLPMPLHRCDIYGSKRVGRLLKKAMSLGSSVHWSEVIFILTGNRNISSKALLEYYSPLILWLEKLVIELNIPLGW